MTRAFRTVLILAVLNGIAVVGMQSVLAETPAEPLAFERHVRPIFKAHCFHCHGEEEQLSGGFDVRLVRLMKEGGDSGPAIVPGEAEDSLVWQRIESNEMPEGPKKLTDREKQLVRRWIRQGAKTTRPEPQDVAAARFSVEELQHWSYQPVKRPVVPRPPGYELHTPVDGFIAERLSEQQIAFSKPASRRTVLRRLTFGLLGLPPTPEEVEQFESDHSPDAYDRLVDRLLASPQFGVRWGRHWLDVAGFAETDGGPDRDSKRPHAWRYRDYVIRSFNDSKSIDQFYLEQLAGDELIEGEIDVRDSRHFDLLSATGFLRMAPDPTQHRNTLADRNMVAADAIKVVSSAMLGVTVGCAQCHDHKYDPIGIDDYYRFRAIFDPLFPLRDWQQPGSRLVDFTTGETRAEADRIEAKAKGLEDDLNTRRNALAERILEQKLADVPEQDRQATRTALLTESGQRTTRQKELLDLYPMVKPVSTIIGLLVEYDMPSYRKFEKEQVKIAELRATKPPNRMVMATRERPGVIPVSAVFFRGNPESPRQPVTPGELMVLTLNGRAVQLPENDQGLSTTGRRLAYARRLTDGSHPLTARVFVNRVWLHHIGRGLVATPSDFGVSGGLPSHSKLLDWLADDFVSNGWDQKRLHRMILLSAVYRQSSRRTPQLDAVDPENELLGRMNLQRLEAEAIRDAILSVAGRLDFQIGGASVPVTENPEGKVVIGRREIRDGLKAGVDGENAGAYRRSVFIEVQRRLPLNMLATFDQPQMNPNCDLRRHSTVATQSLWFLNDTMILDSAKALARHLAAKASSDQVRVEQLFVRLFAAAPTTEETATCLEFLDAQRKFFQVESHGDPKAMATEADLQAVAVLCHTLMASNRFLYID